MFDSKVSTPYLREDGISVALTHDYLDARAIMAEVRSPRAGAIVLFAGENKHSTSAEPNLRTV